MARVEEKLAALRDEIRRHDRLYFVELRPEISDEAYDRLMNELRALEAAHPEFVTPDSPTQRVSEKPTEGFAQVRHSVRMGSIDNTYSEADLRDFDARVRKLLERAPGGYFAEPKIDGVAVSLRFERGRLALAATRGDGDVGDDITLNLRTLRSVPLTLAGDDWPAVLEVRGEVFWPRAAFDAENRRRVEAGDEPFRNPRNATAGTLKQHDPRITAARGLAFSAHGLGEISPFPAGVTRYSQLLDRYRSWGIPVSPACRALPDIEQVAAFVHAWEQDRHALPYETDGLVIKIDLFAERDVLGFTSKSPRWCIAYKYAAEQAQTRLVSVDYQVGKLGTITPVANLDPVELAGTTVRRASLHNFDQVARLGLHVGDWVTVEKAGEIIPQVVAVDAARREPGAVEVRAPQECPSCAAPVRKDESGVFLRCVNPGCPAQLIERLRFFCGRDQMDIEGAGAVLVELLVRQKLVGSVADIFRLQARRDELLQLDRMGAKSVDKLLAAIETAKTRPLARVLAALAVQHVGESTAEVLAEHFGTIDALLAASAEQFTEVEGVGDEVAKSLRSWLDSDIGRRTIADLREAGVNLTQPRRTVEGPQVLAGKTLVVTGTLEKFSRKQIEDEIKKHGGKVSGSVSKKTDYLVAGADAGSKLEKAKTLGVTVLSEAEFVTLIAG
ncbi:MAG: NAD-dependent DNA ligase LigA [Phycisphaerae bacterium]|nr:NAD-dependent DNA ligase LigA [Phycisphaerae bacterium]